MKLLELAGRPFNYEPVGATETGDIPPGFHRLRHRSLIGRGDEVFRRAGQALRGWRMHEAAGLQPQTTRPTAEVGAESLGRLGIGPLALPVPCRVVWVVDDDQRIGFGYGTLEGHPESGEEAFLVSREGDEIWFTVRAYSRPARPLLRLAGPLGRLGQRVFARRYAACLRRLATARPGDTPTG